MDEFWRFLVLVFVTGVAYVLGLALSFTLNLTPLGFISRSPYTSVVIVSHDVTDRVIALVLFHIVFFRWVYPTLAYLIANKEKRRRSWRWTIVTLVSLVVWCFWYEKQSRVDIGPPVSRFILQPTTQKSATGFDCFYLEGDQWVSYPVYGDRASDNWENEGKAVDPPTLVSMPSKLKLKAGSTHQFVISANINILIHVNANNPDRGTVIIDGYGGETYPFPHYGKMFDVKLYEW